MNNVKHKTTQTASHTHGPWEYQYVTEADVWGIWRKCDDDNANDDTGYVGRSLNEDNARLIAAAPELLELLQQINYAFYIKGNRKSLLEVMAKTKPLIAKATGKIA